MPPLHEQLSELIRDYRRWKANKTGWCLSVNDGSAKAIIKRVLGERGAMFLDDIAAALPEFSREHVLMTLRSMRSGRAIRMDEDGRYVLR